MTTTRRGDTAVMRHPTSDGLAHSATAVVDELRDLAASDDIVRTLRRSAELATEVARWRQPVPLVDALDRATGCGTLVGVLSIELLGAIQHPAAAESLAATLTSRDRLVRRHAAWRLRHQQPTPLAVAPLLDLLVTGGIDTMHAHRTLRRWARSDASIADRIVDRLAVTDDGRERARLLDLVGVLDDVRLDPLLARIAADGCESGSARIAAIGAASARRSASMARLLEQASEDAGRGRRPRNPRVAADAPVGGASGLSSGRAAHRAADDGGGHRSRAEPRRPSRRRRRGEPARLARWGAGGSARHRACPDHRAGHRHRRAAPPSRVRRRRHVVRHDRCRRRGTPCAVGRRPVGAPARHRAWRRARSRSRWWRRPAPPADGGRGHVGRGRHGTCCGAHDLLQSGAGSAQRAGRPPRSQWRRPRRSRPPLHRVTRVVPRPSRRAARPRIRSHRPLPARRVARRAHVHRAPLPCPAACRGRRRGHRRRADPQRRGHGCIGKLAVAVRRARRPGSRDPRRSARPAAAGQRRTPAPGQGHGPDRRAPGPMRPRCTPAAPS